MQPRMITHAPSGVSFRAPSGWEVLTGGEVAVVAVEPLRPEAGFRANLVLTVVLNADLTFRDWQAGSDLMLPVLLRDYELLDLEKVVVAGHPGGRRVARYREQDHAQRGAGARNTARNVVGGGRALMMQQWFTAIAGLGLTLTATTDLASATLLEPDLAASARTLAGPASRWLSSG